jgi:hypothetical protein
MSGVLKLSAAAPWLDPIWCGGAKRSIPIGVRAALGQLVEDGPAHGTKTNNDEICLLGQFCWPTAADVRGRSEISLANASNPTNTLAPFVMNVVIPTQAFSLRTMNS